MSQENVKMVRYPLSVHPTSRRSREERLTLRFPGVAALITRAAQLVPLRSKLRRRMIRRAARLFLEAYNRKDFESAYALYHPDSETIVPRQLVEVGFPPVTTGGPQANIDLQRRWHAEWGEFRIEPEEVIDLCGRVLALGHIRGRGVQSGVGINPEWGVLITVAGGRVTREQFFFDHGEALAAVGLAE